MATSKDRYYWGQLRAALTAGQWDASFPAKAPNGSVLSWSELFRKFNKHCKGYGDISEVASQNHALALLLAANSKDCDQDEPLKPEEYALDLGQECVLPEERVSEAKTGYETLKKLESSNFDTLNFALAYYAYALGNPSECLSHLEKVPDVSHVQNHIPLPGTLRANTSSIASKPEPSVASSATGSFAADSTMSMADIKDGRAWAMTETFRSLCLQGMSNEKLLPNDPSKALGSYSAAFPLLTIAETEIGSNNVPVGGSGKVDFTSFTQFRELWRWVERLLWRAIVLSSRVYNIYHEHTAQEDSCRKTDCLWTWLRHYSACSAYWPANFRTSHRSMISVLYLRALVLRHGDGRGIARGTEGRTPPWLHTARSVVQEYRAILSVCTRFPKAGERNVKVEEFVDLCVAVWEACGAGEQYTGWVLDVLWWATRLTFNSYRIFRHMTRLLYVSGDASLAKRTLRLYVQVVSKAWQASDAGVGADMDSDRNWVETLVFGVRMLAKEGDRNDLKEAGTLIEKARTRLDKEDKQLSASVDLAEGIYLAALALQHHDPRTRPLRLSDAHSILQRSVETYSTPSGHYHLSLSFARLGPQKNLDEALVHAGCAVEGDPKEMRYWHLLGLLSAAKEEWHAADVALETGAFVDDEEEEPFSSGEDPGVDTINGHVNGDEPRAKDFATNGIEGLPSVKTEDEQVPEPRTLLDNDATEIPPAAILLKPLPDHPPTPKHQTFLHALQIRMTQIALSEKVEGAEGAAEKLREVFEWIAAKKLGTGVNSVRTSIDGTRTPEMKLKSPSDLALSSQGGHEKSVNGHEEQRLQQPRQSTSTTMSTKNPQGPPPPITISPATPVPGQSMEEQQEAALERTNSHPLKRTNTRRVQQMLKNRVHKGGERISTIGKKIGVKRSNSSPDLHVMLTGQSPYQASSIHSRRRLSGFIRHNTVSPTEIPPPPPPPVPPVPSQTNWNSRTGRETRLLSDLWLMSAATFRRLGKIEQAKGAIQEAEVRDEGNPAVWVQLGLYYVAMDNSEKAIQSFQKALFISPDDVPSTVHLCRLYLTPEDDAMPLDHSNVDLAAGMLSHLTKGAGWDVPEAWYYLAKAYRIQGRRTREKECLALALELAESRGVREISACLELSL